MFILPHKTRGDSCWWLNKTFFIVPSRKKNKLINENNTKHDPVQNSIICNKGQTYISQLFPYTKNDISMETSKSSAYAGVALKFLPLDLFLRPQIGLDTMSWWGTSRCWRLVRFLKLWTLSLAISASSSAVISLTTTVSLHSGLTLSDDFPLAWGQSLFL